MSYPLSRSLNRSRALNRHESSKAVFHPNGEAPKFGEILKQPDLAKTLEAISKKGRTGFYEGRVADLIVAEMNRHGGLVTLADLKKYRSKEREK